MKKLITLIISMCTIFTLVACSSKTVPEANSTSPAQETLTSEEAVAMITDYPAAIMVNDAIYLYNAEPIPGEVDESAIIGYTTSYTDTFPEKNGETNFNRELDMAYAEVEGGIAVLYENEWHLCTPKDQPKEKEDTVSQSDWGITLTTKNVTPTGLTIVCTQSGGNPSGELDTGSYYIIQKYKDGEWSDVEWLPQEYDVGWTAEAWIIPMNDTVEWEVDWEWLYGELSVGKYRIGKEIMDFRGTGDYDQEFHYAEFEITE